MTIFFIIFYLKRSLSTLFLTSSSSVFPLCRPNWRVVSLSLFFHLVSIFFLFPIARRLVVSHVTGSGAELGVGFDDFVDGFEEIFLSGDLPASADGKHSRFGTNRPNLRTWKRSDTLEPFRFKGASMRLSHNKSSLLDPHRISEVAFASPRASGIIWEEGKITNQCCWGKVEPEARNEYPSLHS